MFGRKSAQRHEEIVAELRFIGDTLNDVFLIDDPRATSPHGEDLIHSDPLLMDVIDGKRPITIPREMIETVEPNAVHVANERAREVGQAGKPSTPPPVTAVSICSCNHPRDAHLVSNDGLARYQCMQAQGGHYCPCIRFEHHHYEPA